MRSTQDPEVPIVTYEGDLPSGGIEVRCPHCDLVIQQHGDTVEFAEYCPDCGEELFYPGWASW